MPSGNSAAAVLFDLLRRMTGDERWRISCEKQLDYICAHSSRYPAGCAFGLIALLSLVYPTKELVCAAEELPGPVELILGKYAPEMTVLMKYTDDGGELARFAPFTEKLGMKAGKPTLYLCSGGVCGLPLTLE